MQELTITVPVPDDVRRNARKQAAAGDGSSIEGYVADRFTWEWVEPTWHSDDPE